MKGISEILLGTSGRYGYPVSVISFLGMQPRNSILRPKLLVFPGNTLEMQIFIPFSRSTKSKAWWWRPATCLNNFFRCFLCTLKCEKYYKRMIYCSILCLRSTGRTALNTTAHIYYSFFLLSHTLHEQKIQLLRNSA